jgi:hypothetical protein
MVLVAAVIFVYISSLCWCVRAALVRQAASVGLLPASTLSRGVSEGAYVALAFGCGWRSMCVECVAVERCACAGASRLA